MKKYLLVVFFLSIRLGTSGRQDITDPFQFVLQTDLDSKANGTIHFFVDINGDGTNDLFAAADRPTSGKLYHVLVKNGDHYDNDGMVFLTDNFEVLTSSHNG